MSNKDADRLPRFQISRRGVLGGFGASLLGGISTPLLAANQSPLTQAEWADGFDTSSPDQPSLRSSRPTLGVESANYTANAISQYQDIVNRGGWPQVPVPNDALSLGKQNGAVEILRKRLVISGDLSAEAASGYSYDSMVETAVRRFQVRHGFHADGVLTGEMIKRMNVQADIRLQQLMTNQARLQKLPNFNVNRYVTVNIPDTQVETVEAGYIHSRHDAIVGRIDRPTPLLSTKISQINFYPYWHVPVSIIQRDIIPLMQKDPNYLTSQHIRIYDPRRKMEIDPASVNWNSDEATNYQMAQDPGNGNSMGSVKINFPSPDGVYMHDTPSKTLFGDDQRFDSSGCVRVSNVREYVSWILEHTPGWSRSQVDAAFENGQRVDVQVADPVPLYFLYVTAWANADGIVHFRDDIYDRDNLGLAQQTPPTAG